MDVNFYKADISVSPKQEKTDIDKGPVLPPSPHDLFSELFIRVAKSGIFKDPKSWADITYKEEPRIIMSAFEKENPETRNDLEKFIQRFFQKSQKNTFDNQQTNRYEKNRPSIKDYIEDLWPKLWRPKHPELNSRSSILELPNPYIVPGGRFGEIYYWDSYFTMLGFVDRDPDMILSMVNNLAYAIRKYGFIPNGNRSYFLSRSQPPFFHCLVALTNPDNKPAAYANYLNELITEYKFWMKSHTEPQRCLELEPGVILNRYYDSKNTPRDECYLLDIETAEQTAKPSPDIYRNIRAAAESGWDFSSRWLGQPQTMASIRTTEILPVDLNAILFGLEVAISLGAKHKDLPDVEQEFKIRARQRKNAMDQVFWNEQTEFFLDYDLTSQKNSPLITAAALYPLFFGCASADQAEKVASLTEKRLLAKGGLNTTTETSAQQWDSPNGWAPLQWVAIEGLNQYGYHTLANEIKTRWLHTVNKIYQQTGSLYEKYNVVDVSIASGGEYLVQQGFGWTNGVTAALLNEH